MVDMKTPFELITHSLKDYKNNASTFIGFSAWLLLPFVATVLITLLPVTLFVQSLAVIIAIIEIFFIIWITIILSLCAFSSISGQTPNLATIPSQAKTMIVPILTINLLQLLVLLGGLFLLIIPVFIFAVWFGLAQFVALFENKTGFNALSSSRDLTRGRFWYSARLLIIGPLAILLIYSFLLSIIISIVSAFSGLNPTEFFVGDIPIWLNILEALGEIFLLPLVIIYLTHVYLELKQLSTNTESLEKSLEIA